MFADSAIGQWIAANAWTLNESRGGQTCYQGPRGGYLTINDGDETEPAFWSYFARGNEDGLQSDQSGEWDDVPIITDWPAGSQPF